MDPLEISQPQRSHPSGRPPDVDFLRELGARAVHRSAKNMARFAAAGLLIGVVAAGWITVHVVSAVHLQGSGVRAWARVDQVTDAKDPGIIVSYPASPVYVSISFWFGTGNLAVGDKIRVVYDRSDPSRAVVASGLPDPGSTFLVLIPLFFGAGVVLIGGYARRSYRKMDAKLLEPPAEMSVTVEPTESSDDLNLTLEQNGAAIGALGQIPGKGWHRKKQSQPVWVFGQPVIKESVIVVVPAIQAAYIRRVGAIKPPRPEND
jgi:hypothetical protein